MTSPPASTPPTTCDLAIVGAGLVGLATARELLQRRPGLRVAIFEQASEVAAHQSSHNSGVAHAGLYYTPGSLKAQLAVQGLRDLYAYCAEREVAHERCGKIVVATRADEIPRLDELERRGRANGAEGLKRIGPEEITEHEPYVCGIDALWSPETGIVDFPGVARALAADAVADGATLSTSCGIQAVEQTADGIRLRHPHGETVARRAIFCAGAWADVFAPDEDVRIVPFRGAYRVLRPDRAHLVRGLIYPVPDPDLPFLGVHLTRGIDGEVHAGPTALMVAARDAYRLNRVVRRDLGATVRWPGTWRMVSKWWPTAIGEVRRSVSRRALARELGQLVPELQPSDLLPGPSGVRAQAIGRDGTLVDDFIVSGDDRQMHVRNAPSPAATASLALAGLIADRAEAAFGLEPVTR